MKTKAEKLSGANRSTTVQAAAFHESGEQDNLKMMDRRELSSAQRELQFMINHSPRVNKQQEQLQQSFAGVVQAKFPSISTELVQTESDQGPNKTGLPDSLKSGLENLSGLSMDAVKVHYNSPKPAELNARAYTQGTDIHVASGQEKHLGHEGWHVVQQMQGRVQPTMQMQSGVNINDDAGLEKEADVMGGKASSSFDERRDKNVSPATTATQMKACKSHNIQRKEVDDIVSALETVMDNGKLKKAQIIDGLKRLDPKDRDDLNFPRALVEFVKQRNEISDFSITDLESAPDAKFGKKHLNKKWTFRHYTKEKYETLKSLAVLESEGVDASANTNVRDWEELGNQGYVFGLISIDGKVPNRTWLSKMKYYAEYDIKDLASIWVSGDMLSVEGRKLDSVQGPGSFVVAKLSQMLGFINENEAVQIDAKFANTLEAKVPPAALAKPVWNEV